MKPLLFILAAILLCVPTYARPSPVLEPRSHVDNDILFPGLEISSQLDFPTLGRPIKPIVRMPSFAKQFRADRVAWREAYWRDNHFQHFRWLFGPGPIITHSVFFSPRFGVLLYPDISFSFSAFTLKSAPLPMHNAWGYSYNLYDNLLFWPSNVTMG